MCGGGAATKSAPGKTEHGVKEVLWTNLGGGWFFTCLCGWQTNSDRSLSAAAEELEDHWKDEGVKQ